MALPVYQRLNFDPSEHVFLSSIQTRLLFLPNFSMSQFRTLDGLTVGPFVPARTVEVPLWVAISCKRRRKGKIVPPEWLSVEKLGELVRKETTRAEFSEVPFRWLEISKALLEVCAPSFSRIASCSTRLIGAFADRAEQATISLNPTASEPSSKTSEKPAKPNPVSASQS